jgi:sugar lactone lactonase YvrE
MRTRSLLFVLSMCVLAAAIPSAVASTHETQVYTMLPSSGNPEGIAYDNRAGFFYVSHVGTGAIYRGTLDDPVVHPFLPAGQDSRTSATGMTVDNEGRLYIAGASTGSIFVYDTATGALLGRFDTGAGGFLNDVALLKDGDLYVTDSVRTFLWRVTAEMLEAGTGVPEAIPVLPEILYVPGFNLNGIVAAHNGKELITVNSMTGKLYRVMPTDNPVVRSIQEIPVAGGPLNAADGLVLHGNRLFAIQNMQELVTEVKLTEGGTQGEVISRTTDETFHTPTTGALVRDRLLIVNAEFFDSDGPPYTVSSIRRP